MDLLGVFLEGLLSFLSPCVLPLIPLYVSYLAGDSKETDEEGNVTYNRLHIFIMTLFFVLGICLTFVLLSLTASLLGSYVGRYSEIISIIGGTLLIVFGLHQTGVIHIDILEKELKLKMNSLTEGMNHLKAFLLGFVFSLGWSPCIGPMLANAILLATTSNDYMYIIVYGLGFVIPFIVTGLFTSTILNLINRYKNIMKYTLIAAGLIMICFGSYMIFNASRTIAGYKELNTVGTDDGPASNSSEDIQEYLISHEFLNTDGETVRLADYKGQFIFLNFTTTWCTYCAEEIPIYEEFSKNDEIKCFYVMSPKNEYTNDAIEKFVKEKSITVETINDTEGILFYYCGITGYPTTYVVSPEGKFILYAAGAMDLERFNEMLAYAKEQCDSD
ncbi:MAG: redoxin domain-containing protein [Erysipelotrichaceae bacterium]|nr:redoxin domain-containing protein [Erysipelotrichaceae bacterium]